MGAEYAEVDIKKKTSKKDAAPPAPGKDLISNLQT
jgi:hypothetical protein